MGLENNQQYHSIMKEIVNWTKGYHDEVLECLLCLLIFFSQSEGEPFSQNIDSIQHSWKSLLFRYIQSLEVTEDTKDKSFFGAMKLVEVLKDVSF